MGKTYDFSGWATKNNVLCSDGRTIMPNAFADCDGCVVPLIWNHKHSDPDNVLGHALLENRPEGVYTYGSFNNNESGKMAKELVNNGDISALSIFANNLKQQGLAVLHGAIREVSLVLAGANPEAFIDNVIEHGENIDGSAWIFTGYEDDGLVVIEHSENEEVEESEEPEAENSTDEEAIEHADESKNEEKEESNEEKAKDEKENTIGNILDSLNEEQKSLLEGLVGEALASKEKEDSEGGEKDMKHNVFDQEQQTNSNVLSHAAQGEILALAKSSSVGSLRTAMQIYAEENNLQHDGISGFAQSGSGNVTTLFPEYVEANPSNKPELITNDMGWVDAVMAKTKKVPHGRVRTSHVDIRNIDGLAAKGYRKGSQKSITGNYNLVRRTTDPQTVYVTSELHRDDVIDIEDFDYVQFQYDVDQISLKETLAVATMLGDDRENSDPEKIFPEHIRPIWTDDELYTIHKDIDYATMATELQGENGASNFGTSFIYAEAMVTALRMARKQFRGTGKPDLYVSPDMHNTMILARDRNGRRIYETDIELAAALGVANIYEVTQFEGKVRVDGEGNRHNLLAICVNMNDYSYGASKGGDITHFTDFDIKFNQLQSLLETRKSGQLTRIKSAIVLESPANVVIPTPGAGTGDGTGAGTGSNGGSQG